MSAWGSFGPGTRVLVLALGGGVLAGAAALVWQATQPPDPVPSAEVAPAEQGRPVAPGTEAEVASTEDVQPAPEAAPVLPKIDTWRVAPDGEALVAGMALPGAAVEVVVDDRPVAEGVALGSGEFVLQFTLPPNPAPSLLRVSMTPVDGLPVVSPEMVALAPIAGPEIAAAEPEPQPEQAPVVVEEPAILETAGTEPETQPEADAVPTALLVTGEGAVVLQDSAGADPALADQVMIDTISYAPSGSVRVGGRGAAGAALRLYLDNAEAGDAAVADDGRWLVTLGDSAPGIYTLRVDQIDAAGKVTSRFETPFKRETLEALAAASGAAPVVEPEPLDIAAAEAPVAQASPTVAGSAEPDPVIGETTETAPVAEPEVAAGTSTTDQGPTEAAAKPAPDSKAAEGAIAVAPPAVTITVQPGFTLWGIAQERMGDGMFFVQVFEANREKIKDPNLIYPGQVFSIPESAAP